MAGPDREIRMLSLDKEVGKMQEMRKIELGEPSYYELEITTILQTWYGDLIGGKYRAAVSPDELEEIRRDPLRDYTGFGAQSVVLVDISVYPVYLVDDYQIHGSSEIDHISARNKNTSHLYPDADKLLEDIGEEYMSGREPQWISI